MAIPLLVRCVWFVHLRHLDTKKGSSSSLSYPRYCKKMVLGDTVVHYLARIEHLQKHRLCINRHAHLYRRVVVDDRYGFPCHMGF